MKLYEAVLDDLLEQIRAGRTRPVLMGRLLAKLSGADRDAAATEAGLSRRQAYYLVTIAEAVQAGLMTEANVAALGVVRARALARDALKRGRRVSASEVSRAVSAPSRAVSADGDAGKPEVLSFALDQRQAATVRAALARFGAPAGAGPRARTAALVAICKAAVTGRGSAP
ncbi:hypothetical protein [Falsiroseomonas oryziterrae]|uniref:hypothetical protein n=1 Tax=Falsiroseomonas oryziterrae TaxID=2911368 RepID=UPI001F3ED32B|nr:hypothetical protein [Roseomonas sp. NPKOSM-4]